MLSPDDRYLLVASLRPPPGYKFDQGVGTTFTLDLMTLLTVPLGLALYEVADYQAAANDPVALLDGVQALAGRLSVFCQAGRISVPAKENPLFSLLEETIVEVQAPRGGAFHPKTWFLRYTSEGRPTVHRLLVMSRNLTFDRSWDLMVTLEGEVLDRQLGFGAYRPLGDFLAALPSMAIRELPLRTRRAVELLSEEVRRADYWTPEPFDNDRLEFMPSGFEGHVTLRLERSPYRTLVVSPFLSDSQLKRIGETGEGNVLISRIDTVASLDPSALEGFEEILVLDDGATEALSPEKDEPSDITETMGQVADEQADAKRLEEHEADLTGLHAKLFIAELGWDAHWLIGSANCTDAAFAGTNVEFTLGLWGKKSKVGIDSVLGSGDEFSLRALLQPFSPSAAAPTERDALEAERRADEIRKTLIASDLRVDVIPNPTDDYTYSISPQSAVSHQQGLNGEALVRCWPITLPVTMATDATPFTQGAGVAFPHVSLEAITSFLAFEIATQVGDKKHQLRFVLNLPLIGAPAERMDQIIAGILSDKGQVIRYLRLILAAEAGFILPTPDGGGERAGGWWSRNAEDESLLEELLSALSRCPEKLERIADVVDRLRKAGKAEVVFPEGFIELWASLEALRKVA